MVVQPCLTPAPAKHLCSLGYPKLCHHHHGGVTLLAVTPTRRCDTKWSMHRQPYRNNVFYLDIDYCLTMSFNLFQLEMLGNQDHDWGVKTGIIDRPSIRMRGQLCDGRIGRTAVIEQGHHRKKTAAVEMERIEANLRVPWLSKSTAQDTTTLARPRVQTKFQTC